jgi:hypothetical protein
MSKQGQRQGAVSSVLTERENLLLASLARTAGSPL